MKKTIIFDLDGTLLDTLEDLAYAGNQVLAELGFCQHPEEKYRYFIGDGLRVLLQRITPATCSAVEIDDYCARFTEIYSQCWDRHSRPYPGIQEMLKRLQERGVGLAVLSNKPHRFTTTYVKRFFPDHHFELVLGQREGVPKKPDPAGALEIVDRLAIPVTDCLYVGDTAVDMKTGRAAKMFTIGVLWGFRDEPELRQNGADLIVNHPLEIVDYAISTL
ncbi:MAG: HAD family hydrolase [Desulfopila sp.]